MNFGFEIIWPQRLNISGCNYGCNDCREIAEESATNSSDAELELNGLRAEISVYKVQEMDCGGTIIPAYMDINDTRWDDDPRVQHWRRETQLGRVPRRDTPKTTAATNITTAPTIAPRRDPRIRTQQQPTTANTKVSLRVFKCTVRGIHLLSAAKQPTPKLCQTQPPSPFPLLSSSRLLFLKSIY